MKLGKFGYWLMTETEKALAKPNEEDRSDEPEEHDDEYSGDIPDVALAEPGKPMLGSCALSIRFENHGEYLRWKKYFGVGRNWEFVTVYPAIMRTEIRFTNSLEVEIMAKKVVQLLEAGFDVYSAQWKLEQNNIATETTP